MDERKVTVLEIAVQPGLAQSVFNDAHVTSIRPGEDLPDGQFTVVFLPHTLVYLERKFVLEFVKAVAEKVEPMGELWLSSPSLEWAAKSILQGDETPMPLVILYGEQDGYRCGLTLLSLRNLAEAAGLVTRKATQNSYTINFNGKEYDFPQNLVIAFRSE